MITAEQFKCLIPTPNAIKEGALYCSGQASNGWEISGFVVQLLVALATIASVAIALLVAMDSRKRVRAEQAKTARKDRLARQRQARERVGAAVEHYVERVRELDQLAFYAVGTSIENLAYAYDQDDEEYKLLSAALTDVSMGVLEPLYVGRFSSELGTHSKPEWESGIGDWQGRARQVANELRDCFEAMNMSETRDRRLAAIRIFQELVVNRRSSLKVSMERFEESRRR